MTRRAYIAPLVALIAAWAPSAAAMTPGPQRVRPQFDGKVALFGNLHAHSALSDDTKVSDRPNMTPAAAYAYAHQHGLDFLALTDHHKATDSSNRLWLTPTEYQAQLFDVARAYCQAHEGEFVAIPGIEWGDTATGNHVNVLGAPSLPPDAILDRQYDALFRWARDHAELIHLNHPYGWAAESDRDLDCGNFGEALYQDGAAFCSALDSTARLMAVICTVERGHISGLHAHSEAKTHRDMHPKAFREFTRLLNLGFHISPVADQDTHWTNWGTVTAARAGVWADSCSYRPVMDAFRANRAFATEDDELAVALQVLHGGKTYWMGERVPLGAAEAEVTLVVYVAQGGGTDGDPTDEGPYEVTILRDEDGLGGHEAARLQETFTVQDGVATQVPMTVTAGEYLFLEVSELKGKDNPVGEGEDVLTATTGAHAADGKRDDLNDQAWTTPVWFEASAAGPASFVWSKNSNLYHDQHCWAVKQIGSANRREGTPPAGMTRHGCPAQ
jgi:hypothetical protein